MAVLFIVDANVLIDYEVSDRTVLALYSQHIGKVHVPQDIADEVTQLQQTDYDQLDLRIVQPSSAQYAEAGPRMPGVSFEDRLCFLMARDEGWTCISNDGPLRRLCDGNRIPVLWGLEPMLALIRRGHLSADAAIQVAETIHRDNPYVTRKIVDEFTRKARGVLRKASRRSGV